VDAAISVQQLSVDPAASQVFPYLGTPHSGYNNSFGQQAVAAGGVVPLSRMVAAGADTPAPEIRPRPRPRPAASTDDAKRIEDHDK